MPLELSAAHGLLFRIVHVANVPRLLADGVPCRNVSIDPDFVPLGNPELIDKRASRRVPISPGGTLADYVPFYLTPKSPMLFNIKTGFNGIVQRANEEIAILVSSCRAMRDAGVSVLFTDRHAYAATAVWSDSPDDLKTMFDWEILRRHDFARDDAYPDKMERYQAEALAHRHVPPGAILGVGCVSEQVKSGIQAQADALGSPSKIVVRPAWYF